MKNEFNYLVVNVDKQKVVSTTAYRSRKTAENNIEFFTPQFVLTVKQFERWKKKHTNLIF